MTTGVNGARPRARQTALLLTASMGCAMTVLDTNVVGIVLPTIARDLNASFADIEWVISSYVLCFAALLLPAGSIADRYGRKWMLLAGIALFALASLACGMASTAPALYIARALQGAGAACLLAPALAIIGHAFHGETDRAHAWAVWGGIMGLTMVVSPLIGGAIGGTLGWRWAFLINIPLCALLAVAVVKATEESRDPTPRVLDLPGMGLFAAAMFALTWALILGPARGWASAPVVIGGLSGLALFWVFAFVERRRAHPMLDLTLFATWPFVGAVVAMFAYAATAQVMASLLPLFLQNARGNTVLTAGIAMLPFALAMLVLPQVGRKLARWLSSRHILALGLLIAGIGNVLMALAATTGSSSILIVGMAVLGSGGGLMNGETQKAIMMHVPRHQAGMASGISTTARFSGILLGFAGLGAILASGIRQRVEDDICQVTGATCPAPAGFVDSIATGDIDRAVRAYPASASGALTQLARHSYAAGFCHAFLAAAVMAILAANVVFWSMRTPRSSR